MSNIQPYILKRSEVNGFNFYHYLHIRGGAGNTFKGLHRNGGEYDFILFYAAPSDMEGCDICERKWCEEEGIVYGEGSTIEEAYEDYLSKTENR